MQCRGDGRSATKLLGKLADEINIKPLAVGSNMMSLSVAMHKQTKTNKCGQGFMCGDLTEPTLWSCLAVLLGESYANKMRPESDMIAQ